METAVRKMKISNVRARLHDGFFVRQLTFENARNSAVRQDRRRDPSTEGQRPSEDVATCVSGIVDRMMTTTFLKKYKVLQKIGEGSFSEVLKCQDRQTGALFAAKRLKKIYQNISEMLESPEVIAMRKISRHPNILYMIDSHYDPLPGKVTLIFELMDMSLYDLVKARKGRNLTEQRVKVFLYQLLKGLEHLHKHGIFHRDIKPENILLKGEVVKLADLGSIRGIYSRQPYTEYISTRWYRSPECLLTTGFYGPKMDVWATGCVYYELLTLKPLFPGSNEVDQISKIHTILGTPHARLVAKFRRHKSRNCEYFFPNKGGSGVANLLPHVTENGRDILKLMLVYDPENRSNVRRLLDHRYFSDLREKESPRQSSCCFVAPLSARESGQWRNPVLLSYITSERRRKSKAIRARRVKLHEDDSCSKIPRVVASSPNARPSLSSNSSVPRFEKSSTITAPDDARKKLERSWRGGVYATRTQLDVAAPKTQSSEKLPAIKLISKATLSRGSSKSLSSDKRAGLQQVASLNFQKRSSLGALNSESRTHFPQKRESPSCSSLLPQIALRSTARNLHRFQMGSAPNFNGKSFPSNPGVRQTRLATITEQQQGADALAKRGAKSPQAKSPAKKIAKHEMSTSVDSPLQPVKRLKSTFSGASFKRF